MLPPEDLDSDDLDFDDDLVSPPELAVVVVVVEVLDVIASVEAIAAVTPELSPQSNR